MCTNLNIEEGSSYEIFQLEKKAKMSYRMVQHLTHTFELPHIDFKKIKQGVIIERKIDG